MYTSDTFSLHDFDYSSQHATMPQEDFQVLYHRKVEPAEPCKQPKQEAVDTDLSFLSSFSDSGLFNATYCQPSSQASNLTSSNGHHHDSQTACGTQGQDYTSGSSYPYSSDYWSYSASPSRSSFPMRRDNESRRFLPSQGDAYSSATRTPSIARPLQPGSDQPIPFCGPWSSGVGASFKQGPESRDHVPNRLKKLEESVQCFWLVSENRMSQIQQELHEVSSRVKSSALEQEQVSSQVSRIHPLQVQMNRICIRADEDRKVILGRIKALEESTAAWQTECKSLLETMQTEFRAGMEAIRGLTPKPKRAFPTKVKSEPAGTLTAGTGQKRASPPRKKASPASAKKAKIAPATAHAPASTQEDDCVIVGSALTASISTSPIKERRDLSQEWTQRQHARFLEQQQHRAQQSQQHQKQVPSQPTGSLQHQSLSQPTVANGQASPFERVQLQPRPRTATSYSLANQQSLGSLEVALGH